MPSRTLLAIGREDIRGQVMATLTEIGEEIELLGVAENSQDLLLAIEAQPDIDLVLIDEHIGSLPYLALTREVVSRVPDVGVILMVGEPDANAYLEAMDAGARAVVESPPALGDLSARLPGILGWQRQVRGMTSNLSMVNPAEAGRMIVFTGAKGGVGTSTLALHLALLAAASNSEGRVCLIDLDLQQRGLRHLIEVPMKRTIADLVTIADSLTGRNLDEATIVHRSGLRLLMAPEQGERADEVDGQVVRQILAAAKGHYDLVVVDAGSVVSEASAVGMEFADDLLLVTTPDIATLRAAQDKHDLLSRLQIIKDVDTLLLFNKVSPRNEVQPEFGARMALAQVCKVTVPEDWRRIEPGANALTPTEIEDGPFRRSVISLGRELGLSAPVRQSAATVSEAPEVTNRTGKRRRRRKESGQVTIDAVVGLAAAMVILLVLVQATLMALGVVVSKRAADRAARIASQGGSPASSQHAGFYDVSVTHVGTDPSGAVRYRATVESPTILPWLNRDVSSTAAASAEE